MARANVSVKIQALEELAKRFQDPFVLGPLRSAIHNRGIAALVAQGVADTFRQEGPGWQELSAQTIRRSVAKKLQAKLKGMSDKQIKAYERGARNPNLRLGEDEPDAPRRQILRRTSLLFQTVTTIGFSGSSTAHRKAVKDGSNQKKKPGERTVSGQNINRIEGTNLIWGTNLVYAAAHEYGIGVPPREFLKLRPAWEARLQLFALKLMRDAIAKLGTP